MTLPVSCLSSAVTSPKKHLIFIIYELFIRNVSVEELSVKSMKGTEKKTPGKSRIPLLKHI